MRTLLTILAVAMLCVAPVVTAETIKLEAEDYKIGGEGVGYHDDGGKSGDGNYRPDDNVDVENSGDSDGSRNVGWTNGGEWLILTEGTPWEANPAFAGGDYYVNYRIASPGGGGPVRVEIDGISSPAQSIGATGGWQNYQTFSPQVNPWLPAEVPQPLTVAAGSHEVKFVMDGGGVNVNWLELTTDAPVAPAFMPMRELTFTPPQGGDGYWGVREVYGVGGIGNLDEAFTRLNADADGTNANIRIDYQAMEINIHDSDGVGNFGVGMARPIPDSDYMVVTQGNATKGSVDNVALVMSGKVVIPADGIYSFIVNSDDGFELAIDGNILMEATAGKGSSDVFAKAQLTAGVHDIRVVNWEGAGGASIEVLAAAGDKTGFDTDFLPIGHKATGTVYSVVDDKIDVMNGWSVVTIYDGANSLAAAIEDVESFWADPTSADNGSFVRADVINYFDPDNPGGGGHGFEQTPFPGEVFGVDENSFAFGAKATINVTEAGEYTFMTLGDDGSRLRIPGTGDVWSVAGADVVAITDGFELGGCCHDAFGTVTLTEGEHDLELIWNEIGGGAYIGLWAAQGTHTGFNNSFQLVGEGPVTWTDDVDGLQMVPEPSTLAMLLGLAALGLFQIRRRK